MDAKRIAEYADLHGILVAPHGIFDGLFGLAAHVHLAAVLPQNYIAFEYPIGDPKWRYDIVEGPPDPGMQHGFIDVWNKPDLGVRFNPAFAKYAVAQKEAREGLYWLEWMAESGLVPRSGLDPLIQETNELTAILTTIIVKSKRSKNPKAMDD